MLRFLLRRVAFGLLLVFVVSSLAALLTRTTLPSSIVDLVESGASREAIAREEQRLGLDRPVLEQYARWLSHAARLDFGRSQSGQPVGELVRRGAANTALLAFTTLAVATLVGIPLGVLSGSRRRGAAASGIGASSLVCVSLPPLVTSLVLVFLAARTGWFPIGGMTSVDAAGDAGWWAWARDVAWHLPVPALALALPLTAMLERLQSQATRETLGQPFMLGATARGVPRRRLIWRDSFKASLRPVASIYGLIVGGLLSGSFIVENVTSWPGLGRLMFDGLRACDLYLVAGCAVAGSIFIAAGSLMSDIALAVIDPRLDGEGRS